MTDLTGKGAVVTGASRGIGAATARVLAGAGAHVVLAARTEGEIGEVADEIRKSGGQATAVTCDVTDYGAFEAAIKACEEAAGQLDILVNNAGVIEPIGHLADSEPEEWIRAAAINYKSVYYGLRIALPRMKAQGSGIIINISSGAAHGPMEGWSHYCSAKAAAHMLTRCADKECRDAGVTVMGLSPGTVATDMQRSISASGMNPVSRIAFSDHIPADWPARAILWLTGPDGAEFAGDEVKLRDSSILHRIGLTG